MLFQLAQRLRTLLKPGRCKELVLLLLSNAVSSHLAEAGPLHVHVC
jgi:hypothetical protein